MKQFLEVVGGLLFLMGAIGAFLLAETSIQQVAASVVLVGGLVGLSAGAVLKALKELSERPTAAYAADKVAKQLEELRSEVKALRTDLDERANEVRSS